MKIRSESVIGHPRDKVYVAYRDRLPEIAAYLPNIDKIEEARRDATPSGCKLHNIWHARGSIPKVASAIIKPDMLKWDDFAEWHDADFRCSWQLKTRFFTDSIACSGATRFSEDGPQRTRVSLDGELTISLEQVRAVPGFLRAAVAPQVERFVVALVTPNLKRVNSGLEKYLDAQA